MKEQNAEMATHSNDLTIHLSSTISTTKEQVSCDLAGEAVILHLDSGVYFGLNEVGADIWNLVQAPAKVSSIKEALLEKYNVEPNLCEQELILLLQQLRKAGLIEVSG